MHTTPRTSSRPEAQSGPDRRVAVRIDVEFDITFQGENNFYAGLGQNISEGGLFVATHELRAVGELLFVQFTLPGIPEAQPALCEVCWIRQFNPASDVPPGMGLRFVDISSATRALVERFVAKREPLLYE